MKTPRNIEERFWEKVEKTDTCWNWKAYVENTTGYGRFGTAKNTVENTHRWLYFHLNPGADRSLWVLHHCDNPKCVNPAHLYLGTPKNNVEDMIKRGRVRKGQLKGEKHAMATLNETQALLIRACEFEKGGITRLANILGIHRCTVSSIHHGKSWKHLNI